MTAKQRVEECGSVHARHAAYPVLQYTVVPCYPCMQGCVCLQDTGIQRYSERKKERKRERERVFTQRNKTPAHPQIARYLAILCALQYKRLCLILYHTHGIAGVWRVTQIFHLVMQSNNRATICCATEYFCSRTKFVPHAHEILLSRLIPAGVP